MPPQPLPKAVEPPDNYGLAWIPILVLKNGDVVDTAEDEETILGYLADEKESEKECLD